MEMRIDLPEGIFDAGFTADEFSRRLHEMAIIELIRQKRIHEHEAIDILGCDRPALIEKMRAAGVMPTEEVFAGIRNELQSAIDARRARDSRK
jgi:hypothetical protein